MTDNFIAFFYRERLLVAVVSCSSWPADSGALSKLNVDAFPDVTPVQVEIDTEGAGAGAPGSRTAHNLSHRERDERDSGSGAGAVDFKIRSCRW